MRLLFVTARFPYPPTRGDKAIPYHRIKALSVDHEVALFSFSDVTVTEEDLDALRQYCVSITVVRLSALERLWGLFRGVFSRVPFQVHYYRPWAQGDRLASLVAEFEPQLVNLFTIRIAPVWNFPGVPVVIDLIDSMALNLQRRVARASLFLRPLVKQELKRMIRFEKFVTEKFDHCVVVSEKDAEILAQSNLSVVPLGVDIPDSPRADPGPETIVFSGRIAYGPNRDAILWFAREVYPLVCEVCPARFVIAGADPPKEILDLARRDDITVTGYVQDLRSVIRSAALAVAPMVSGSGMQFKVLEALAEGVPVVATSIGRSSIDASSSEGLYVADTAAEFASVCAKLLRDDALRARAGRAAYEHTRVRYSWQSHLRRVMSIYHAVVDSSSK